MRKYPFTPALLDSLPEELAELFRSLELTLLSGICSRLNLADQLNEVTVQHIRALRAQGVDLDEIKKTIQKETGIGEEKLDELISDVVARNQSYYTGLIDFAGLTQPEFLVGEAEIDAIRRQTLGEYRNLTRSMAFVVDGGRTTLAPAKAYQWALDNAVLQIESGTTGYNQAISSAVRQLADSGLRVVSYESGRTEQVDVAVRRAVMTGVSQLCDKYTVQSAEYLGTHYFEVSAHSGARDKPGASPWSSHKDWQGKVYSERTGDIYPSIYEACGLGEVDGLEGVNCRHRRFPFIPGVSERTYTDEELSHIDDGHDVTYDGKHYTAYEATQMQRRMENSIRKQKRRAIAFEKAGLKNDAQAASIKARRLTKKYKDFSKAAKLPEQRARMEVRYADAVPQKASQTSATPRPAAAPKPAPTQPASTQPPATPSEPYDDVTEKWREDATPNSHEVQDLQEYTVGGVTYKVDGHNVVLDYSPHEKEVAELLEKEFGGELYMVPRVNNPQGVPTPDYLFRGERFDLKTLSEKAGPDTIFQRIKKATKQARRFVVDVSAAQLDEEIISQQIKKLFQAKDTKFLDTLIIVRDGRVVSVLKRA